MSKETRIFSGMGGTGQSGKKPDFFSALQFFVLYTGFCGNTLVIVVKTLNKQNQQMENTLNRSGRIDKSA
ncbi:hypothetical protein QUF80_12510 [Desulfococcaceae bacterium HSG8]|nr:hypothetical protein [Desulfococcaceae bacterium HSG8]